MKSCIVVSDYLSPVWERSDKTRATLTVVGRKKNVINEGAHITCVSQWGFAK